MVIPSCAEQKHQFADWTLFLGKFAASLGSELGMSPQEPSSTFRLLTISGFSHGYKWCHNKKSEINQKSLQSPGKYAKKFRSTFSSILSLMGGDFGRTRQAKGINTCLQDWHLHKNLEFLNDGIAFERQGMLGPDGIHLSWWEKQVFGHKVAGMIERALN